MNLMEVKKGWLSSMIAITKISLRSKCDHDSVTFLSTLSINDKELSLGYCSKCERIVFNDDDSCMKKLKNFVDYDSMHNKFRFGISPIGDPDKVYPVEYEVVKYMLTNGEISLPLNILHNTINAAKSVIIQKENENNLLSDHNTELEKDIIVLTQLINTPPENNFNEVVPCPDEFRVLGSLEVLHQQLFYNKETHVPGTYSNLFKHILSTIYGYDKARTLYEWNTVNNELIVKVRTKSRRSK